MDEAVYDHGPEGERRRVEGRELLSFDVSIAFDAAIQAPSFITSIYQSQARLDPEAAANHREAILHPCGVVSLRVGLVLRQPRVFTLPAPGCKRRGPLSK